MTTPSPSSTGTLYICATPIGNLEDITLRTLRILKEVDLIAAEDTRNSLKLLSHFDIHTPMTSYHEHNRYDKARELVRRLKEGTSIALITDAGTPAISDPGEVLVRLCHEEGITVTALPGACACIDALSLSGMDTRRFCFEGFLPPDKKQRAHILESLAREERTAVLYEAPHHLRKTLEALKEALGEERELTLCRELTKKHEEVCRSTIGGCLEIYDENDPRGEYVLILGGADRQELIREKQKSFEGLTLGEHMELYTAKGMDRKEAMKAVAKDLGISRREVYAGIEGEKRNLSES